MHLGLVRVDVHLAAVLGRAAGAAEDGLRAVVNPPVVKNGFISSGFLK